MKNPSAGHQLQQDHQQFTESFPVASGLVVAAAAAAAAAAQHRQLLRRGDRLQGGAQVGLAQGGSDGCGDPKKDGGSECVTWHRIWKMATGCNWKLLTRHATLASLGMK